MEKLTRRQVLGGPMSASPGPSTFQRLSLAFAAGLAGMLLSLSVVGSFGLIAPAAYASTCANSTLLDKEATISNTWEGVKSNDHVYDSDVCSVRIASLSISNNDNNYVEIGWYEEGSNYLTNCDTTNGTPHLLVYALYAGNTFKCRKSTPSLSAGQNPKMTVDVDTSTDNWFYYMGLTSYGYFNMNFSTGEAIDNGERHNTADLNGADFTNLQKFNLSQAWVNWTNTSILDTGQYNDTAYYGCVVIDTHTTVQASPC